MDEIAKLDIFGVSYCISGKLRGADLLVVSFNHLLSNDLRAPGFDQSYLDGLGCDVIFCKSSSNDWYQGLPAELLQSVIESTGHAYKRIVFYGSSMGGYAAIYFGLKIGGVDVVAISPQYTPKSEHLSVEQRWNPEWSSLVMRHKEICTLTPARPLGVVSVVYDSCNADRVHVELLKGALGEKMFAYDFKYAGHPAGYAISRFGVYRDFVGSLIAGKSPGVVDAEGWLDFVSADPECSANALLSTISSGLNHFMRAVMAAPGVLFGLGAERLIQVAQRLGVYPEVAGLQRLFANAASASPGANRHIHSYASGLAARDGLKQEARRYADKAMPGISDQDAQRLNDRVNGSSEDQGRVHIATMQKNEGALLLNWFIYHARIVGPESIFVLDNGSTDSETLRILGFMQNAGARVIYTFNRREHFADKGNIILREAAAFYGEDAGLLLIDVDEFMYARVGHDGQAGGLNFSPAPIRQELRSAAAKLSARIPFARIDHGYYNVPRRVAVCGWQPQRLIVHGSYKGPMDLGMHLYDWGQRRNSFSEDFLPASRIGIIHCHHRSFEESREKAREKMVGRLESFDVHYLRAYKGNGVHLVKYFLMTPEEYYDEFSVIDTKDISDAWAACDAIFPFSGGWPDSNGRSDTFRRVIA